MSYKLPSTHIYQLLENSGGAANVTPDLSTVIIGTLMNLVDIDIDKAKARSSDFSVWPRQSVNPPEPEPEPEPEIPSTFTIDPPTYVDFGMSGKEFTVTGTSSADIGQDIAVSLIAVDLVGNEVVVYPNIADVGVITRNTSTGVWTLVVNQSVIDDLNFFGTTPPDFTFKVSGTGSSASGSKLVKIATVTRMLAPMTTIGYPVLNTTVPSTLTLNQPNVMYSYENVIIEEED